MRVQLELPANTELEKVLTPSLESDETVSYTIESEEITRIDIQTGSLGPLRGATDTVFRLAMLGNKILQR